MPIFLTDEQVYRMIQRELPEGAYPDGPASGFYSTADSYSTAKVVADSYSNLDRIYENYFPQTADEKQTDWETLLFGQPLSDALTLQQRRDQVIAKLRSRQAPRIPDLIAVVKSIIGDDKDVEIIEWGCYTGGWMLDESQLDIETFLNGYNLLDATGPGVGCSDGSEYGISPEDWAQMRIEAYTYEVRIYNYTLTTAERAAIDAALLKAEPARSAHVITDGLTDADKVNGDT